MFGLFKRKPIDAGPITFDFDVLIERPASDVYPLIDWADPRNAKRQLGHIVEGHERRFTLRMSSMPDHRFDLTVLKAVPNEVYSFACKIEPAVGKLAHSTETYLFEPAANGRCLLRLVNEVQFVEGLSFSKIEREMMAMSVATNNALIKLKVLAELGADGAKSVENATFC